MLPYRYRSLDYDDSIRLLVLHASSGDHTEIQCTIQHVRLSDTGLGYEAISYTWGDAHDRYRICLEGGTSELSVGRNCYNALRHLRLKDRDRRVWVDAICIDQENLGERSSQVRIMDRIYNDASSVVVHLGEETPGSRVLFVEFADANVTRLQGRQQPWPSYQIISELEHLIQRAWFKRVWVLQEVRGKRTVTFMCGSSCAPYQIVRDSLFGYDKLGVFVAKGAYPIAVGIIPRGAVVSKQRAEEGLWDQLFRTRNCLATDPRDKVFALKALVGDQSKDVDFLIDYTKSVEEVFTQTALFLLPIVKLDILQATGLPHGRNMASWIPDWSQTPPGRTMPYGSSGQIHRKEGANVLHCPQMGPKCFPQLHAEGIRYAKIIHMSQPFVFNSLEDAAAKGRHLYGQVDHLRAQCDLLHAESPAEHFIELEKDLIRALDVLDAPRLHAFISGWDSVLERDPFERPLEFFENWQHCRLAVLDKDSVARIPDATLATDIVCLFRGAAWACVLRQVQGVGWTLVSGNCQILGVNPSVYSRTTAKELLDAELEMHKQELEIFRIQ